METEKSDKLRVRVTDLPANLTKLFSWNLRQIRVGLRVILYRENYLKPIIREINRLFPLTLSKIRLARPERIALTQQLKNLFFT